MDTAQRLADINGYLITYFLPVLFLFGLFGNALIILAFAIRERSSTTTYFISLAFSDIGFTLSIELFEWLNHVIGLGLTASVYKCNVLLYATLCFITLSNATVALVVLERVLVVTVPLRVKTFCTSRRSYVIIAVLWPFVFLISTYALIGYGDFAVGNATTFEKAVVCEFRYEWYQQFVAQIGIYVELFVAVGLEILTIIVGNIIIVCSLYRHSRATVAAGRTSQLRALTTKTLVISTFHLICMLPWMVYAAIQDSIDVSDEELHVAILDLLKFCSHFQAAFNVVLYILCGGRFRETVKSFLCARCSS